MAKRRLSLPTLFQLIDSYGNKGFQVKSYGYSS